MFYEKKKILETRGQWDKLPHARELNELLHYDIRKSMKRLWSAWSAIEGPSIYLEVNTQYKTFVHVLQKQVYVLKTRTVG